MHSHSESGSPSATTFRFKIPGPVPSWNQSYRIAKASHRGGGSHLYLGKSATAANYQLIAASIARRAKPPNWKPEGQVRVVYWFRLKRAMDATNGIKILEDAVAAGIEVDDKHFLPCVAELSTGHKEPHVEVEVSG